MMKLQLSIIIIFILSSSTSPLNLSSPITSPSSSSSSSPSSSFLNLTQILHASQSFFTAASEFQSHGIVREIDTRDPTTIFFPNDKAFADASVYKSLSDNNKYLVLASHVLREYLPPAVLSDTARVWHLQDTMATDIMGKDKFMVNITSLANGSVAVTTTNVRAVVYQTLYNRQPITIYAINKVLMPVELPHSTPTPVSSDASVAAALSFFFFLLLVI